MAEQEPKRIHEVNKTPISGGVVFENRSVEPPMTQDALNQIKLQEIEERAIGDNAALRNDALREKVKQKLSDLFGDKMNDPATLDLIWKYRGAVNAKLSTFVESVEKEEEQSRKPR